MESSTVTTAPKLTPAEQLHIQKGGRVFMVEQIPGPRWRVLCVSAERGCWVLLKPEGADGYSDAETAYDNARSIANLSVDNPMVRPL